jgi:hypothetical protein
MGYFSGGKKAGKELKVGCFRCGTGGPSTRNQVASVGHARNQLRQAWAAKPLGAYGLKPGGGAGIRPLIQVVRMVLWIWNLVMDYLYIWWWIGGLAVRGWYHA